MEDKKELQGLGGFLVLIGIGVCINPLRGIFQLLQHYNTFFKMGLWEMFTSPQGAYYVSGLKYTIIYELVFQILILVVQVWLLYLFFSKNHLFPKVYIGMTISVIVFGIVDFFLVKSLLEETGLMNELYVTDMSRSILFAIIGAAIWIPYMLMSVRVKQTFIKNKKEEEIYMEVSS